MPQFDLHELAILQNVQGDGRKPVSDLAQEIGLSNTPTARRFDGLVKSGVISSFSAILDRRKLGLDIEAFVQVSLVSHDDDIPNDFMDRVQSLDAVVGCWALTGDQDFLLHVFLPDVDALHHFTIETLLKTKGVRDVRTNLVLKNIKGPGPLPLGHLTN